MRSNQIKKKRIAFSYETGFGYGEGNGDLPKTFRGRRRFFRSRDPLFMLAGIETLAGESLIQLTAKAAAL